MENDKQINEKEEENSPEILHIYSGFENEAPIDQTRRKLHNQLVLNTYNKLNLANSNADKVNLWLLKLRRMALVKKIQQIFFVIFGAAIVIWGLSMTPVENGLVYLGLDQIGIVLAGIGIFASAIITIFSWDDDIMQLAIISHSDENLMFAEFSSIQSQLSFIKNEIIDLKRKNS
ncbi:MAG TPA: hypothetical protein PKG69_05635 [Methanoregulaceae archaeon]|nr:hypothetical protein [Methanoregulaceae archaeon]